MVDLCDKKLALILFRSQDFQEEQFRSFFKKRYWQN